MSQETDDADERPFFGDQLFDEMHEAAGRESMSLRDDDDARQCLARGEPSRDVALRTLVARDPDSAVPAAVGEHVRVLRLLPEDIDERTTSQPASRSALMWALDQCSSAMSLKRTATTGPGGP